MATTQTPGAAQAAPQGQNLVLQDDKGTYYQIPVSDLPKYKIDPNTVGGGNLVPAGCAVCCYV